MAVGVIASVCVAVAAFLLLPSDVVETRYSSLAAARADHLFDRGWLPDILPPSAHDIRTSNDLDLDAADGEFSFQPTDSALFVSRVRPYRAVEDPPGDIAKMAAKMRRRGFKPYSFTKENSTWVFFCKAAAGHCEYAMWSHGVWNSAEGSG